MQLEMPYLMNVLLYIQNKEISLIPFVSKKSQNACNAMRINPWFNWSKYPLYDLEIIKKTFPRLETLRIDSQSLLLLQPLNNNSIIDEIKMIEIINPEYGDYRKKFDLTILDKLTISYSGEIYNQTKRIMCDYYHASDIKDGCVSFIRINTKDYISGSVVNVINNLRSSIGDNVTIVIDTSIKNRTDIELLRTLFKNNIFVINTYESFTTILNYIDDKGIDYINPLENTTTMKQYEEYYLPMKLICTTLPIKQYDFTIFKYVKDITFGEHTIGYPTSIQLPTSVEYVNFKYQHNFDQSNWKITNWKELHNIKQIEDYGNLDIPYPQIQYEHNNKTPKI